MTATDGRKAPPRYTTEVVFRIYDLAKSGYANAQISTALGLSAGTLSRWAADKAPVAAALELGRRHAGRGAHEGASEYFYDSLDEKTKAVWDRLSMIHDSESPTKSREAELLLGSYAMRMRKVLFVHALVKFDFNTTKARAFVRVHKATVDAWLRDPDFAGMLKDMKRAKKDLFESALVGLVKQGDSAAVLFANKTYNRDRGYGEKVQHDHRVAVAVTSKAVGVEELLPLLDAPTRYKILDAMRRLRGAETPALPPAAADIPEAEYEVVGEVAGG